MKYLKLSILLFFTSITLVFAQDPDWEIQIGDELGVNRGNKVTTINDFVYVLMDLDGSKDVNPGVGTNNFSSDNILVRYNQHGTYLAGIDLDDGLDILFLTHDGDGNIFIAGEFQGTVTIDGTTLTSNGGSDIFYAKFSAGLAKQFAFSFGGALNDFLSGVEAQNNFMYLLGDFRGLVDFNPSFTLTNTLTANGSLDMFVGKYNSNTGAYVGVQNFGSALNTGTIPTKKALARKGSNLYIYSRYGEAFDVDPSANTEMLDTNHNTFILVLSINNQFVAVKTFEAQFSNNPSIDIDDENNIYVADIKGEFIIDGNTEIDAFDGDDGFALLKFKHNTIIDSINLVWSKSVEALDPTFPGFHEFNFVTAKVFGKTIHLFFNLAGDVDFNGAENGGLFRTQINTGTEILPNFQTIVVTYDEDGNYVWGEDYGVNIYADEITDASISVENDIYIVGRTQGNQELSNGNFDFLLFKYGTSSANDILDYTNDTNINAVSHTVTAEFPYGTDLSTVTPFVALSPRAIANPSNNEQVDLTSSVVYTVTAANGTEQDWTVTASVHPGYIAFTPIVYLQGGWVNPQDSSSWMSNDLVQADLIPKISPYPDAAHYIPLFTNSGINAVLDWVYVELRDPVDPTIVVEGKSGLVRANGTVFFVDASFATETGSYYVAIHHRNHLSIMSANAIALNPEAQDLNFYDGTVPTFGTNAQLTSTAIPNGRMAMWAGDSNDDGSVKFSGDANDSNVIKGEILADVNNVLGFLTYESLGYSYADANLNGGAKFSGDGNDTNMIKSNVLSHPTNILGFLTFAITEQLP